MNGRKRVYVALPFRAETEMGRQANIWFAKCVGVQLAYDGYAPIVPHATVAYYHDELPEEKMMDICLSLLSGCDLVYADVSKRSVGVEIELDLARERSIPIMFKNTEEYLLNAKRKG